MLDDLNNLPDFEHSQLIHVHPYRWTSIASNGLLSSKELEAVAEQDEEFAEVIEVMLAAATAAVFLSQTFSHEHDVRNQLYLTSLAEIQLSLTSLNESLAEICTI